MCGCGGSCSSCRASRSGSFGLRRTLVTLDLSAYDIGRLVKRLQDNNPQDAAVLSIAKQIEAQTKPPKPAEPQGLGAVVEDAEGNRWVLADPENEPSWTLANESDTTWEKYREIDAVRVLSEGVSA